MIKPESIKIVNLYFTPFATALILIALLISNPGVTYTVGFLCLMLFSIVFNNLTSYFAKREQKWSNLIGVVRLFFNLFMNIIIVYFLGKFWGPLWLLFVLTPIATAIYSSTRNTIVMALLCSLTLMLIYLVRGLSGIVGWGQAISHVLFIIVISLFVHNLILVTYRPDTR
ncbi:MAG: hypothetical protein A2252_02510 [Elusimicrobia bacterium RIFOXYA2_FULL_39_19]|nr:MAG: hypothetical protein A2252_02510 [Elusimicrobia bacterium RIFOXYA2_FULL_39_19]